MYTDDLAVLGKSCLENCLKSFSTWKSIGIPYTFIVVSLWDGTGIPVLGRDHVLGREHSLATGTLGRDYVLGREFLSWDGTMSWDGAYDGNLCLGTGILLGRDLVLRLDHSLGTGIPFGTVAFPWEFIAGYIYGEATLFNDTLWQISRVTWWTMREGGG